MVFKIIHIKLITLAGFILITSSCQQHVISDKKQYFNYLSDPINGLVKEKSTGNIKIKVKYLTSDYLAFNTVNASAETSYKTKDSVKKMYDNSITFLLNIGPADNESFDITRLGVDSYEDFAKRIEDMAFGASEWMSLTSNNVEYKPVITKLESVNAIENSRNFIVVFNSEKNTKQDLRNHDLCFTYADEIFHSGINKFIFKTSDLNRLPEFNF